jgi:hypothetical protein
MAKALQCPSCGTKKRLDGLATDTFRCENCGQVLKVPPVARPAPGGGSPSPPPRGGAAAPPPRRHPAPPDSSPEPPGPPPRPAPAAPPVVASPSSGPPGGTVVFPAGGGPAVPPVAPARGAGKPPRAGLPLTVRVGAWVLAVPIGLAIIGVPARILGYLTSQKLLDVIVKHNLSRFVPLLVIVVLWALATTVLVELFVEGGRWLMLRRRRRSGGPDGADEIDPGPVPPRPSSRSRRPAGARRS